MKPTSALKTDPFPMTDPIDNHFKAELNRLQTPGQWALWPAEQGQELIPYALNPNRLKPELADFFDPKLHKKYFINPSDRVDFHHVAPDGKQIVGMFPHSKEAATECLEALIRTGFWDKPAPENPAPPQLAGTIGDRPAPDEKRGVYAYVHTSHLIEDNS